MIYFKKIKFKNFLSYGNKFTEIILDRDKKTVLLGESGSGKSTLLDALKFVCFNKPYRNITKNQLVNTINNKDCIVEIEFDKGNKKYKIVRGIKPNIFEIYCNGKLINQDSAAKDYQKFLENNILGFNSKSFDQIVVVGASNFTPFMQLKPADRRTIIEELLDLQVFGVMGNISKERVSGIKSNLQNLENEISIIFEKIKIHEKHIVDLENDQSERINKIKNIILETESDIEKYQNNISSIESTLESLKPKLSVEGSINQKVNKFNSDILVLKNKISSLEKDKKFFEENSTCTTCKQEICDELKNTNIDKFDSDIYLLNVDIEKNEKELIECTKLKSKIEKIKSEYLNQQSELKVAKAVLDNHNSTLEKQKKELNELEKPSNNIENEKKELKRLKNELKRIDKDKEDLLNERKKYDFITDILRDSGIKSQIIKQYIPLINQHTNKFLSSMNFFSTFYLDENFNESIKSRGYDSFTYSSFSEGEKQRIDLALLLTWRVIAKTKNSVSTNLLVMDEIFDSYLDIEATEAAIDILNSKLFDNLNIFVISHKNNISDKFDNNIGFEKVKNFSRIK